MDAANEEQSNLEVARFRDWRKRSARFRAKHKLPGESQPWTQRCDSGVITLAGLPKGPKSERLKDVVDVAFSMRRNSTPKDWSTADIVKGFWVNPSQCVSRAPWSSTWCPTPHRNSLLYSFEHDAALSGPAVMVAHGCPSDIAYTTDAQQARDLGGEVYSVPATASVITGIWSFPMAAWHKNMDHG